MIHKIEGKLTVTWNNEVKAVIDTWIDHFVTLDQFNESILQKGLKHAKANGGRAWIVDSSNAKGAFPQSIQKAIGEVIFPAFSKNGIKYFITITPKQSAIARMTVSGYSAKTGPNGLKLLEVNSVNDAIQWLKQQP